MSRNTGAEPPDPSCCVPAAAERPEAPGACPDCGRTGKAVGEITLKSLLRGPALARRSGAGHRFCATPTCPVVYFRRRVRFTLRDLVPAVFQKETDPRRTVCYCFEVSEASIRDEVARTGTSTASRRIRELVESDRCACELRNPQGSCCLGNVLSLERAALGPRSAPSGGTGRPPCPATSARR
ncbi:MAG: hypothetical protein ACE5JH_06760 [Acidobacteriota bacterium]